MTLSTLAALGALAAASPGGTPQITVPSAATLASFDLADGQVQSLALTDSVGAGVAVQVVLDGELEVLELTPHSMRGANFEVLVQGADGALRKAQVAPARTVRGTVAGRPDAWVAGSLEAGQLDAIVSLGDGRSFGIQPVEGAVAAASAQVAHVIYEADDILAPEGFCATPDGPHQHDQVQSSGSTAQGSGVDDFRVCEIACDADVEYYNKNGMSVDATVEDIERILIAVEAIYGVEAEVLYEIGTIIVRTAEPDPYSSTSPGTLLQQFDNHWSSQQQGVQRDIAHLFTGKNLDGSVIGIARLNAICSQTNGYGLSSRYTNSLVLLTRLVAHELGHNWSAQHCNGASDCGIMCQGGCGSPTEFGVQSTNSILQEKNSSGCLSLLTAAPVLTGVSGPVTVWQPETIEVQGADLFTATSITVDGQVTTDFSVADDETLLFLPPLPTSLDDVQVSVTTPLGTSNEVALSFLAPETPQLAAPGTPGTGQLATWGYGGEPNAAALMVFGFENATIPVEGIDLLLPEEVLIVAPLDSIGLGQLTVQLPPLPIFTLLYSQLVTIGTAGVEASEIASSVIFI